ncbi:MAG: hypothetical protein RLZZ282_1622 [Verrucomicrobiota bacterium]
MLLLATLPGFCQDIEPRRWSHLPIGSSFGGVAYAYTDGDISFNPVLRIEDGEFNMSSSALKYIYAFEMLGKSARVDLAQTYQNGTWRGLLDGVPTRVDRDGWADTSLRCAVNLYGAPPLAGQEFRDYRANKDCETIVGIGLVMQLPTGQYYEDKLINLGSNRCTFTPQFGLVHTCGKWSIEFSTSASFYTTNDDFFNGKQLEDDCYLVGQGHLIYTFMPGLWLGTSLGYGYGGQSTINGISAHDRQGNLGLGLSVGIPVNRAFGFKIAYVCTRTDQKTGADTNTLAIGCSLQW